MKVRELTVNLIGVLYLMPGHSTWTSSDGKTDDVRQTSSTHTWLLVHHPTLDRKVTTRNLLQMLHYY